MQDIDFAHRIEKVRARMEAQGLDFLVATKLGSRHYLAGALMPWRSAIVIPRQGDVSLTTTSIDSERVAYDTWIKNVRPWELALRGPSMAEVVAQIISDGGFVSGVVGLETDDFTMNEHQELTRRSDLGIARALPGDGRSLQLRRGFSGEISLRLIAIR